MGLRTSHTGAATWHCVDCHVALYGLPRGTAWTATWHCMGCLMGLLRVSPDGPPWDGSSATWQYGPPWQQCRPPLGFPRLACPLLFCVHRHIRVLSLLASPLTSLTPFSLASPLASPLTSLTPLTPGLAPTSHSSSPSGRALSADPHNVNARFNAGELLLETGKLRGLAALFANAPEDAMADESLQGLVEELTSRQ